MYPDQNNNREKAFHMALMTMHQDYDNGKSIEEVLQRAEAILAFLEADEVTE